jgi:phytoene synthase
VTLLVEHHTREDPPDPDAAKDADNLAFLASLPADVRAVWQERCRLLRWVDQLAERDRWGWVAFLRTWRRDEWLGQIAAEPFSEEVFAIWSAWFEAVPRGTRRRNQIEHAWATWLDALSADYGRSTVPRTLEEHDQMLLDVGGFFRLLPYLTPEQWESIGDFGALDQAWNNVRDIAEDAEAERCYFPTAALRDFGLIPADIMTGAVLRWVAWKRFMSFWLDEHLPSLRERAQPFLGATDLHPSVAAMRACCLRRYERVERVLRGVDYDYRAFPKVYAAEVRRELGEQAMGGGVKEMA